MVVQHNLQAMNANRMLGITTGQQAKSTEKLSSGYRINRAADDAAGLTISEKMRKQIRGLNQASTNAEDGISAVQTAEGALTEVHSMLQRMNELAVQASNGTMSADDRQAVQSEIDQLVTEIDRVSETTKFNEIYLLKGAEGTGSTTKEMKYSFELTDTAKAAETGVLSLKASAPAAYGAGETDAITGTATASMSLNATALNTVGAGSKLYANTSGNNADNVEVTNANITDYFDVANDGTVTAKAGVNFGTATSDGDATTGGASWNSQADATQFVTGSAATTSNIDNYVEVAEDGSLKYKDGKMLYTAAADAAGQYGEQKEATAIAEADLGNYFESTANPLTDSTGNKITDLSAYFEDGAYKGGIYRKNDAGVLTEIGAEQIDGYITVIDKEETTTTAADPLNFSLHVGAESAEENKISVSIKAMSAAGIGVDTLKGTGLMTEEGATDAIDTISAAIKKVSEQRSTLGAVQNRLEHTIANLDNVAENTSAAESRIRDVDMAEEMVEYSKNNILAQAGQSMLAQANQSTQGVLSLLG